MAGKLTAIYAARTVPEAHYLRSILLDAGIQAVVTSESLQGAVGSDILGSSASARVAVAEEHAALARQIALEFDQRIALTSRPFAEEPAESESSPRRPDAWPWCPSCGGLRITKCPICETAGTEFAQADPDFVGTPAPEQDAKATSWGCGSCGDPAERSEADSDTEQAATAAREPPTSEPAQHEADTPRLMLICPTCDEPFVPEYPRRCEWCGHQFADGYEVEIGAEPEAREQVSRRAIAVVVGLLVLAIVSVVYFAWLF